MMNASRHWLSLLVTCAFAPGAMAETALSALKALPRAEARKVTGIQATEGAPAPQAWTFRVPDGKAPQGWREYVVVKGEIVSSQAAGKSDESRPAKGEPLLGNGTIKIDSDEAAAIAMQQAKADGIDVVSLNYRLQRSGPKAAPIWVISCLDAKGGEVGSVAISAATGNLLAQDGFAFGGHSVQPSRQRAATDTSEPRAVDPQMAEEDRKFLAAQSPNESAAQPAEAPVSTTPPATESSVPEGSQPPAPETVDRKAISDSPASEPTREVAAERRESSPRHSRGDDGNRSTERTISPVREIHRATAPVRHIIRRVLPF